MSGGKGPIKGARAIPRGGEKANARIPYCHEERGLSQGGTQGGGMGEKGNPQNSAWGKVEPPRSGVKRHMVSKGVPDTTVYKRKKQTVEKKGRGKTGKRGEKYGREGSFPSYREGTRECTHHGEHDSVAPNRTWEGPSI